MKGLTLSYFCSALMFAMPPHNREVPRTRRRLERMEPRREYLTTAILLLLRAKIAMMSSVAFPHVAFKSPPTVIPKKGFSNMTKAIATPQFLGASFLILTIWLDQSQEHMTYIRYGSSQLIKTFYPIASIFQEFKNVWTMWWQKPKKRYYEKGFKFQSWTNAANAATIAVLETLKIMAIVVTIADADHNLRVDVTLMFFFVQSEQKGINEHTDNVTNSKIKTSIVYLWVNTHLWDLCNRQSVCHICSTNYKREQKQESAFKPNQTKIKKMDNT